MRRTGIALRLTVFIVDAIMIAEGGGLYVPTGADLGRLQPLVHHAAAAGAAQRAGRCACRGRPDRDPCADLVAEDSDGSRPPRTSASTPTQGSIADAATFSSFPEHVCEPVQGKV